MWQGKWDDARLLWICKTNTLFISMQKETKISLESVYKSFGNNHVLDGISLGVTNGSSLVIIGPSGAGKTVLIKTIVGLFSPDRGNILIDGMKTANISAKERYRIMEKCGFLFQNGGLLDSLTVQENITFFAEKIFDLSANDKKDLAARKLADV